MEAASAVGLALGAPRARKKPDTNRINIFRDPDDRKPPPQSSKLLHQQQQLQPCLNNTVTDSSTMIQHPVIDPFEEIKPFSLVKTTTATTHNDDPLEEKPFNQLHYNSPAAMEGEDDDDEDDLVECLSKTKTPQPLRRKREQQRQPRKENNQRKKQHIKKSDGNDEEKQQKMRVIRIRISDPYATDDDSSSSDEEEGAKESAAISKRKRQILHIVKIPFLSPPPPPPPPPRTPLLLKNDNDDHKQELVKEASCLEGKGKKRTPTRRTRTRKNNNYVMKPAGKKKGGPISSPTCPTDRRKGEQKQGEKGIMESIAWPALRCIDVPGPVPENLDSLMHDATLLINFYDGLPDY